MRETLMITVGDAARDDFADGLVEYGFRVLRTGQTQLPIDLLPRSDVVLVDLDLPGIDAISFCRAIRAASDVPMIVLTDRGQVGRRIEALHAGADDYLVKPCDVAELVARFHAINWRRGPAVGFQTTISRGEVEINLVRQSVTVAGVALRLSRKELQILALIAAEDGAVCPRERLVAEVWGRPWPGAQETLNVHLATLRAKLKCPDLIETVRGIGYRLAAPQFGQPNTLHRPSTHARIHH